MGLEANAVRWSGRGRSPEFIATAVTKGGIHVVGCVAAWPDNGPLYHPWEVDNGPHTRGYDLMPRGYTEAIDFDNPEEHVPTLGGVEIEPRIVRWSRTGERLMHGSQMEQTYRRRLKFGSGPVFDAEYRARQTLMEMLNPLQRLEFISSGYDWFVVRGKLNSHYVVRRGDGIEIVKPVLRARYTRQGNRSFVQRYYYRVIGTVCYHGPTWIPNEDVMLQQKLMIENDEATMLREGNVRRSRIHHYIVWKTIITKRRSLWLSSSGKLLDEEVAVTPVGAIFGDLPEHRDDEDE